MLREHQIRLLLAIVLASSAILFLIGAFVEHNQSDQAGQGSPAVAASVSPSAGGETGSETTESHATTPGQTPQETRSETLFGINPESTGLVAAGVIAALLLAGACWWRRIVVVLLGVVGFGLIFGALDVREMVHQLNEHRETLGLVAGAIGVLHGGAALLAGVNPGPGNRTAASS